MEFVVILLSTKLAEQSAHSSAWLQGCISKMGIIRTS